MTNHLFDGLLQSVDRQATFATLPDGRDLSYESLFSISAQMANALVESGLVKGDRVAVQVPKSIEAVLLYLACVRVGAIFLPLNTAYTVSEVEYFLTDAAPKLFVCDPQREVEMKAFVTSLGISLETMGAIASRETNTGSFLEKAKGHQPVFESVSCSPSDLAAILYTSGTTGRSKGAMLSHDNLLSNSLTLKKIWHFTQDDVLLHALPIFHTHGLFVATNIIIASGASMIFLPAFDVDVIIEKLPQSTTLMGVPTFYTRLLSNDAFTRELTSHMRLFVSGSAPLLAETHLQFEERTGHRILERYGMTETNMNTSNPYNGERRAGTVGFPLPDVSVRVVDPESKQEVPAEEIGVLEVSGPNVFSGYWNMPEKTAEEFREDGFFITGDLAKIDQDGYVHIVGRSKDLIISGGYNIYPKELELLLDDLDNVVESAVIGVPHSDFGEAVVAVIVSDRPDFDEKYAMDALKTKIARFKQPRAIKFVSELPRNAMGKVQKNVLRETYAVLFHND